MKVRSTCVRSSCRFRVSAQAADPDIADTLTRPWAFPGRSVRMKLCEPLTACVNQWGKTRPLPTRAPRLPDVVVGNSKLTERDALRVGQARLWRNMANGIARARSSAM